jgi:nicotinamide-nucleotide adenylyltransferase
MTTSCQPYKTALIIGRFQPPHIGHKELFAQALSDGAQKLIIVIGSSQESRTAQNPLTVSEREQLLVPMLEDLKQRFDSAYQIIPVPDINDYPHWVEHVNAFVPPYDVTYSGNVEGGIKLFETAGIPVIKAIFQTDISSTQIRTAIRQGGEWKQFMPPETLALVETLTVEKLIRHTGESILSS